VDPNRSCSDPDLGPAFQLHSDSDPAPDRAIICQILSTSKIVLNKKILLLTLNFVLTNLNVIFIYKQTKSIFFNIHVQFILYKMCIRIQIRTNFRIQVWIGQKGSDLDSQHWLLGLDDSISAKMYLCIS